jgi:nicotinate phosphoribosyltransferase
MGRALLTDLYELNMAASYLRRGMTEPATFSLFVRDLPPQRGFLVAAGLHDCLRYLETLRFEDEDLSYLRDELEFDEPSVDALRQLRFTGDVWAVPEGRIMLAEEPLLEVTAPIAEAQLVETFLLNRITAETALASKAARCVLAARGRGLVDFSFRRTQGLDAALSVARVSAMVGFAATSNVEAARVLGLPVAGTMAHSYIEAFPSEEQAFRAFAADHPDRCTFLVDTFEPMQGVRTAAKVMADLGLEEDAAIRLDSGDLAALATEARRILDEAGLNRVRIFASGGLDEYSIASIVDADAPIDAFGVGTRMGVSADAPSLDSVYKLVQLGDRPVMKLSPGKATAPGPKQVFRGTSLADDVIGLRDDEAPGGHEPILVRAMEEGRRVVPEDTIEAARDRFERDLAILPEEARRIRDPAAPHARHTRRFEALAQDVRARATR